MASSISKRIFRTFFLNSTFTLVAVIALIMLVVEDMEDSLVASTSQSTLEFLRRDHQLTKRQSWETESMVAYFQPAGAPAESLPQIFRSTSLISADEISWQDKFYHVFRYPLDGGTYYLAKDVSLIEKRELLTVMLLVGLIILATLLNFFLSIMAQRSLVKPLRQLTLQIRRSLPGHTMAPIDTAFKDSELVEIANSFNQFLDEIESLIKRERIMISLASHELRTPTAVIAGAVQVMEQRESLSEPDLKTLQRIKQATQEMEENITSLLAISRPDSQQSSQQEILLDDYLLELINEFRRVDHELGQRIHVDVQARDKAVYTNPSLVRMVVRNLVQNAAHHTSGNIHLVLTADCLDVLDEGPGLPKPVIERLNSPVLVRPEPGDGGLGLFIVTLICEQLDWRLEAHPDENLGAGIRLWFSQQ